MELNAINPLLVRPANWLKFTVPVCSSHVKRVLQGATVLTLTVKPFLGITFTVSTALSGISFWPSGFVIGWVTVGRPSFYAPQQSER